MLMFLRIVVKILELDPHKEFQLCKTVQKLVLTINKRSAALLNKRFASVLNDSSESEELVDRTRLLIMHKFT